MTTENDNAVGGGRQIGTKETKTRMRLGTGMPKPTGAGFVFELLDIDGDGHITQTEYNKGFDILDKDKNDFLTRDGVQQGLRHP